MTLFDLPLRELRTYRPALTHQADFAEFWEQTLAEAAPQPLNPQLEPRAYPVPEVAAHLITYEGWQGAKVRAWYLLPQRNNNETTQHGLPAMVFYHHYQGSKKEIYRYLPWVLQGYAVLAVDVRGQLGGSNDSTIYSSGHIKGWLTQGILHEAEYYYRGVYVDAILALDFLATRSEVDMGRVGVTGFSQGGGVALAVAALDDRPQLVMPNMPFLCHIERPLQVSQEYPYWEIADYLRLYPEQTQQVFRTLSYFDNLNLAARVTCPALFSVGLIDETCPPSTIFAVYNRLDCPKKIEVFPYHKHEIPDSQWEKQLHWANHFLRGVVSKPE